MALLRRPGAAAAAVAACAAIAWLPALGAGFVSDDFVLLQTAEAVENPLWPFAHNDLGQDTGSGHFYRPLWVLWNAGVLELFGDEPGAFHAANLFLFALIAVEVFLLARLLLPTPGALAAGLAFALYPRHGESAAWASGSTDLLAVVIGLGALLVATTARAPGRGHLVAIASLTAAAALAKEAAFALPLVAAILWWALPPERRPERLLPLGLAMGGALAAVLVARTVVLGGAGGYGDDSFGPGTVGRSVASYAIAAFSPPQLGVLLEPLLLAVPLTLAAALALGVRRLEGPHRRVALAGVAWFGLSLLPVLGLPLDLNNSTGERLLLLPSAGLALTLGALVPARPARASAAALGVAAVLAALLCADVARTWVTAGDIAERVSRQAARLAPAGAPLLVVTIPESYRSARVFTNSFDVAVRRAGRPDASLSWCIPVGLRDERSGQVRVTRGPADRSLRATTTADAPFDFPVRRDPAPLVPGCSYAKTGDDDAEAPGLRLGALARPEPPFDTARTAWFDGRDVRLLPR